jgi:hypothetical protein
MNLFHPKHSFIGCLIANNHAAGKIESDYSSPHIEERRLQ